MYGGELGDGGGDGRLLGLAAVLLNSSALKMRVLNVCIYIFKKKYNQLRGSSRIGC